MLPGQGQPDARRPGSEFQLRYPELCKLESEQNPYGRHQPKKEEKYDPAAVQIQFQNIFYFWKIVFNIMICKTKCCKKHLSRDQKQMLDAFYFFVNEL